MHEVLLERAAERDLDKLPPEIFNRVVGALSAFGANPRPPGARKITGSRSDFRIRIGDYRVIYSINDKTKQVLVMKIRRRREVYR